MCSSNYSRSTKHPCKLIACGLLLCFCASDRIIDKTAQQFHHLYAVSLVQESNFAYPCLCKPRCGCCGCAAVGKLDFVDGKLRCFTHGSVVYLSASLLHGVQHQTVRSSQCNLSSHALAVVKQEPRYSADFTTHTVNFFQIKHVVDNRAIKLTAFCCDFNQHLKLFYLWRHVL